MGLLGETPQPGYMQWALPSLAVITVLYFAVVRPMFTRRKDPLEKRPFLGLAQQREVEQQMSNLLVELSQMARQITAQLDTRAARLEALLEEADRKIEELRRLNGGAQQPDTATPLNPQSPLPPAAPPEPSCEQRHGEIYAMADAGLAARQIAERLDRPVGEVELILALRNR